jgi:hypothetical protein
MTPTQSKAKQALEQMLFRVQKQNRWDEQQTEAKAKENPKLELLLHSQLGERQQQRLDYIEIFKELLQEAVTATDQVQSMYHGFVSGCDVPDVFAVTEDQSITLSVDQLITIGYAHNWRNYFPELSRQQAIFYAITEGCPHFSCLRAIRYFKNQKAQKAA